MELHKRLLTAPLANPGRRTFISQSALAGGAFALGVGATAPACPFNPKNLSAYVSMIAGGFGEIKVLLPDLGLSQALITQVSNLIDRGVKVAKDFDSAYKAGKFTDASALFNNLGSIITQVITTLGVSIENRAVKVALAAIGIARVAIAILLQKQAQSQPQVLAAAKGATADEAKAVSEIERLAATDLSAILAAMKPGP